MADLPHVTGILKATGLIDTTWFNDEARALGTAVHRAAQFLDEGNLNWSTVDPRVAPRLHQYQRFLEEKKPEILAIEERVTNEALRYCGKLDRRIRLETPRGVLEGILDLKAPSKAPWHGIQLSMYASCFPRPLLRWSLHLFDERYQLVEHKGRQDWLDAKTAIAYLDLRRRYP